DQAGGGGEEHVGSDAGDDDEVDGGRVVVGLGEDFFGGFGSEVGRGHALIDDVALTDAGAGADPFIAGLDEFGEVVVGHDVRWDVASDAGNFRRDAVGHSSPCAVKARKRKWKCMRWRAVETSWMEL